LHRLSSPASRTNCEPGAAQPFHRPGRLTRPAVWDRLVRVFRGEFIGFALWFN
jgi:hypothetical protein